MRKIATALIFNALFVVAAAAAVPPVLTSAQLFDLCASQTIAQAEAKGDAFGRRGAPHIDA